MSSITDHSLAPQGETKIEWVSRNMPLLSAIEKDFEKEKPFQGLKIALSIHLEAKTAYLCRVLASGGAQMFVTGSNPLSTQDDVAAALASGTIEVFAHYGASQEQYEEDIIGALSCGPNIIIDDGGDLVSLMHTRFAHLLPNVLGGCEETTTGILRLKAMAKKGELRFPMIMVNEADCKHLFDNRYGTGQSSWDAINRTTNLIVAGKTVVVAGYGWCGRGVAMRAKGLGARVVVTEIDPVKAIEAHMDGFDVMTMDCAAQVGDIFVTVTGCNKVISERHFQNLKDGAILTNAGHFNVEIDMESLEKTAVSKYTARTNIEGYRLKSGRTVFVVAEGRLVNLASGDGHPAEIMDMSFAIQALSAKYIADNMGKLEIGVVEVPKEIDTLVAKRKLDTLGVTIDELTNEQREYMGFIITPKI